MKSVTNAMKSADLSVQQLRSFKRVFELGGFTAAARDMELAAPTVWQQIQAVERLYGVQLFKKHGRGIEATKVAARLYQQVSEVLAGIDSTFDLINDDSSSLETITLVAGTRIQLEDLAVPLAEFRNRFANHVVVRSGNHIMAEEMISSGEADFALSLEPGPEQESKLIHYEPAYPVEFFAMAQEHHPFIKAASCNLHDLVKHELLVTIVGTYGRDALDQALYRERLKPRIVLETDNCGFTIACAAAGLGVGVVGSRPLGVLSRGLVAKSLSRQLGRRNIVFLWQKGREFNGPLKVLLQLIRDHNSTCKTSRNIR